MFDVAVIGAGITGAFVARELSKYQLSVVVIEKDNDVANGTTKANSAIVHAGYDALPGTLKAQLNVRGNTMYDEVCQEMHVPFKRVGSLVIAFNNNELELLEELYGNGLINGVSDMEIISKEKVLALEPNVNDEVVGALYAKTAGIVGPWELAIALAENALDNGVELILNSTVTQINKIDHYYYIKAGNQDINAKLVINCAGVYADKINNMVSDIDFKILPFKGEYDVFDKNAGNVVSTIIFGCPSDAGKGVVILPTVHGNLLIGPTSETADSKDALQTTSEGLRYIQDHAKLTLKEISFGNVITSFTGLRAKSMLHDFIIEEAKDSFGFFNVAGIDSPGLTAAPAIAEYVLDLIKHRLGNVQANENFISSRRPNINFIELSDEEKRKLIQKDPRFGRIICRCEGITEGEIIDVIHRKPGAKTLDGVKRRARPGSGRCQGGFCTPRVMEIIAREIGVNITEVVKDGPDSYILTGGNHSVVI